MCIIIILFSLYVLVRTFIDEHKRYFHTPHEQRVYLLLKITTIITISICIFTLNLSSHQIKRIPVYVPRDLNVPIKIYKPMKPNKARSKRQNRRLLWGQPIGN